MATASHGHGLGGMLREWTFSATLEHKAARITLRLLPQWIVSNLDADEVAQAPDPLRKFTAIKPFLAFRDLTASVKMGDMWEEVEKVTTLYRCRLAGASMKEWCKRCIQLVISDERTVSLDGNKRLQAVAVGDKLRKSPWKLGGHRTFMFTYTQHDKTATITDSHHIAVGTIVDGSGYLVLVSCTREEELNAYVTDSLMPSLALPDQCKLNVDVTYTECPHATLAQQQELFGMLRYFDKGAAIEFTLPMHPLHMRPDHSPLQSAGFGSLACLTLDLEVFQKLYDEADQGGHSSVPGMPRYKPNSVVLYVEVEDVVKIGFPPVMSVDQYAALKTKKLLDTFRDARVVGAPLSLPLGQRVGRSTTCTFSYEMEAPTAGIGSGGIGRTSRRTTTMAVKAIVVTTLVGNHGATAVYFTKLGQAIFDSHLYIFHHLLRTLHFYTERDLVGAFSKEHASRVRLTDQDLPRAYAAGGEKSRPLLEKHLKAIHASTDGETEDATIIVVKAEGDDEELAESTKALAAALVPTHESEDALGDSDSIVSVRDIPHLADLEVMLTAPPPGDGDANGESREADAAHGAGDEPSERAATSGEANASAGAPTEDKPSDPAQRSAASTAENRKTPDGNSFGQGPGDRAGTPHEGGANEDGGIGAAEAADDDAASALVMEALRSDGDGGHARGPALRGLYKALCDEEGAKPNSYLVQKLPDDPRFTSGIEELDMSFNYVGHAGFRAILRLLAYLPKLRSIHFNSMSLDNADVEVLCRVLAENRTVTAVHIKNNARVSLPSSPHLLRLLRQNRRVTVLTIAGSAMSSELVAKIEGTAIANRNLPPSQPRPPQSPGSPKAASMTRSELGDEQQPSDSAIVIG
jgi:hypothetical protein